MLSQILPLTVNKLLVLEELYKYGELNLASIAKNTSKVQPLIFRTLNELNLVLEIKVMGKIKLYSIKEEYILAIAPLIERIRFERALGINVSIFNLLKNSLNLKKLFIFGSYAKGFQKKNSDLDLFIVSNESKDKINFEINKIKKLTGLNIEVVIYNKMEFENLKQDKNSNFYHILFSNRDERIEVL